MMFGEIYHYLDTMVGIKSAARKISESFSTFRELTGKCQRQVLLKTRETEQTENGAGKGYSGV